MKFECPTCHKEFETQRGMRIHHAKVHEVSLREAECEICGEKFLRWDDEGRFCSPKCAGVYFSFVYSKKKTKLCDFCGEPFEMSPSRDHRFCNRECYRRSVRKVPVDVEKFRQLLKENDYGTGTVSSAAGIHPDELHKMVYYEAGEFQIVRKLESVVGSFRKVSAS